MQKLRLAYIAVQMVLALQLIAGAGKLAVSDVERDNVANDMSD
jgi:hypothetical protein